MNAPNAVQNKDHPTATVLPERGGEVIQAHAAGKANEAGNGKKTVLFIEDDPFVLKIYKKVLNREGFHVETAEDGLAALELLPRLGPDLVVLDLMLPKLHGLEVLKFIRAEGALQETPVIVLSNAFMDSLAQKARQAGANLGLSKSRCTPAKLVDEACALLGLSKAAAPVGAANLGSPALAEAPDPGAETAIWSRRAGMRKEAPMKIAKLRQACLNYIKAVDATTGLAQLNELYRQVRFLSAHATLTGFSKIGDISSALEALLFEIVFRQSEPTSSTFQTVAQAVDFVDRLLQINDTCYVEPRAKPKVLVVDDDAVCNFAFVTALQRGNCEVVGVQDPVEGLRVLNESCFDLVLLDINLPHMDGFEVCAQLRRIPRYLTVPVVFITINAEFRNRARSVVSGGNDLIAKPVSPLELILKVTMHLLKGGEQNLLGGKVAKVAWSAAELNREPVQPGVLPAALLAEPSTGAVPEREVETVSAAAKTGAARTNNGHGAESAPLSLPDSPTPGRPALGAQAGGIQVASAPGAAAKELPREAGLETQLRALQTEYERQCKAAAKLENERPMLMERVVTKENELHRAQARVKRRDERIKNLHERLEQITAQPASSELTDRLKTLEAQASDSAARLERALAELEILGQEKVRLESDLQQGLEAANASALRGEQSCKLAEARCAELEQELARLREVRDQLDARVAREHQANADLQARTRELEAGLNKQPHESQVAELSGQLKQSEAARLQAQARAARSEQELDGLYQVLEELDARLAREQQAGAVSSKRIAELEQLITRNTTQLECAKGTLNKQAEDYAQAELDLRKQLEAASSELKQSESGRLGAQARSAQLEQELAGFRQVRDELNSRLVEEAQAGADSAHRIEGLELLVAQNAGDLHQAKFELKQREEEQRRLESDLCAQLQAALASRSDLPAHPAQLELERQLAELSRARDELSDQLAEQKKTATELHAQVAERERRLQADEAARKTQASELEQQKGQGLANLARATAELAKERGERQRSDERAALLNVRLQELHEASQRWMQSQHADQQRIARLADELGDRDRVLLRQTADLEQQTAERRLAEEQMEQAQQFSAHLRKKLAFVEEAHQTLSRTHEELQSRLQACVTSSEETYARLQREIGERRRLETALEGTQRELQDHSQRREALETELKATLEAAHAAESKLEQEMAERQRLAAALDGVRCDLQHQRRKRESLETELQRTLQGLHESESRAQQETAERLRLNEALESAQLHQRADSHRAEVEMSKLLSALRLEEVERKRRETQLVRLRQLALASARSGRLLRKTLRRQIGQPVEALYHSAFNLLQLQTGDEQHRLAEAILRDVLLVQTRLQEPEPARTSESDQH